MKKIVPEYLFSPEELNTVRELARAIGITETAAGILFSRGQRDEAGMRRFLHPSRKNFLSPFLMKGMKEAVELLKEARDEGWRVAVFGDYDADGIGACAIMERALKAFGIEPYLYVPEREEGYGMSVSAVDAIFDEFLPDLVVTVDCGISNYKEVGYIKEQGAYVIVTDHHELPEILPDCICINPKFKDDYPYDNLCGAGVAFKLATALLGERAYSLLDFCALSTVADSVPLTGENRDIVYEGLAMMKRDLRPVFSALLGKSVELTAQTLAFTLAPRVNAAGRMGDARAALRLFTTEDEGEIFDLAAKLQAYNLERQQLCDDLYERAHAQITAQGVYENIVMLVGENWHAGLIGIVAARLAEEFARPVILFVKKGNMLRGSARSIENVNIFEALKSASSLIEEFGGHAQAAGVNVKEENFGALKRALDEYLKTHYSREEFVPAIAVSEEVTGALSHRLAEELEMLEPYGVGNRRPLFVTTLGETNALPIKPLSPHLSLSDGGTEFMYFGGYADLKLLRSPAKKQVVFEYNLSTYRGRESLKGFIRAVVYNADGGDGADGGEGFENLIRSFGGRRKTFTSMTGEELNALIAQKDGAGAYGLCVVAQEAKSLAAFPALEGIPRDIFRLSSGSVRNVVLLSPDPDCDLSAYRDIVFLETPPAVPQRTGKAVLYANSDVSRFGSLEQIDVGRAAMVEAFRKLRAGEGTPVGETYLQTARRLRAENEKQLVFALAVFSELGLLSFGEGRLGIVKEKRAELTDSAIYSTALALTQG